MKFKFFRSRLFKTNLVFKLHQPVSYLKIEIIFVSTYYDIFKARQKGFSFTVQTFFYCIAVNFQRAYHVATNH